MSAHDEQRREDFVEGQQDESRFSRGGRRPGRALTWRSDPPAPATGGRGGRTVRIPHSPGPLRLRGDLHVYVEDALLECQPRRLIGVDADHRHYKWWALSCTSLGMLLATINSGTLIIALPDLERSLGTCILALVWVILAYMIASTVLVLTAGRLSDLFGRKRAYVGGLRRLRRSPRWAPASRPTARS